MRTNFTPEEDAYIIANHRLITLVAISKHLERSYNSVYEHVARMRQDGRLGRRFHRFTPKEDKFILERFPTCTKKHIGVLLGVSEDAIRNRHWRLTHKKPKRVPQFNEPEIIRDGYDAVPWWCRQSTRSKVFRAQMYDAAYYYDQRKEASVNSELLDITQKI